jgi:hypothetical protein
VVFLQAFLAIPMQYQAYRTLMDENLSLSEALKKEFEKLLHAPERASHCFIGFDGFTDDIVAAVQERLSPTEYRPFPTISIFGKKICEAEGKSCNIELVPLQQKIGGNSAILANALIEGGHKITLAATIGMEGQLEPLFAPLLNRCYEVIPLGPSGHSDAIEFRDGKVIFGKMTPLLHLTLDAILQKIPKEEWRAIFSRSHLIVNANWTMTPVMNTFWHYLLEVVLPSLRPSDPLPYFFVDLADPAKRSDGDILTALDSLKRLGSHFRLILGLNKSEAMRLLSLTCKEMKIDAIETAGDAVHAAKLLKQKLGLYMVLIHCSRFAVASDSGAYVETIFCENPAITTGAGDHFNAGFCNGLLYNLPLFDCLATAVATAGYYVRNGKTPTIPDLSGYLEEGFLETQNNAKDAKRGKDVLLSEKEI